MPYLENLTPFRGTGENNRRGQSLEEFLTAYNPKKYDCPSNTVDMLIFCCQEEYQRYDQPLKLLMIRRGNHPNIGYWALPGGFVDLKENLEDAARRELEEETGIKGLPLIQLRTWGDYDRDPRWRVITTAYLSLVTGDLPVKAGDDAADALWMEVSLEMISHDPEEETYTLTLSEQYRGVLLQANIVRKLHKYGILSDYSYKLISSNGIAGDHGLLITDAILYLRYKADLSINCAAPDR